MRSLSTKLWILLAAALLMSGCSGGGDAEAGPGSTVKQFFTALNEGDYDAARAMYDSASAATVNDPEFTPEGAYREWAETITKRGAIREVRILGTEEAESSVVVSYELLYGDGSNRSGSVTVTQEAGSYRLGLVN